MMLYRSGCGAVISMLALQSSGRWFDPPAPPVSSDETINRGPVSMT